MSGQPSARVRAQVWARARGCCERCGAPAYPGNYSYHHRRIKGMGGDKRPDTNLAGNIVLLCGSGTTGCHGRTHQLVRDARDKGWLVSRYTDPTEVAVALAMHGPALLLNDGTWAPAPRTAAG